jgi:hypothetical protein
LDLREKDVAVHPRLIGCRLPPRLGAPVRFALVGCGLVGFRRQILRQGGITGRRPAGVALTASRAQSANSNLAFGFCRARVSWRVAAFKCK